MVDNESTTPDLSPADQVELNNLVSFLELSSGTTTIFAIAPQSSPQHPVVEQLKFSLKTHDEDFEVQNFFYSDNSLHNFLYSLGETEQQTSQAGYRVVMAFGIDQLPTPRLVREMKQLNLGRDSLFAQGLVLIFWLNKAEFLDEFRDRAPDFWDWRGKLFKFEKVPTLNRLFYPYIEWLIAENSYLKISGVMQVQRQVDIFLDQIYVSLQAQRRKEVAETGDRGGIYADTYSEAEYGHRLSKIASYDLDEPYSYEPAIPDFLPISTSTKTVTQKVDLSQAVRETQYSVILGDPGAGKTTLLRYLALHFATAKRDEKETVIGGEAQEELGKPLLPIFFRIADYAEQLDKRSDLSLLDYLLQFYRQWEEAYFQTEVETEAGKEVADLLLDAMRQGQCLMLLDGLDEVFDQQSRSLIVKAINQFVDDHSANKFVITSRIAGYRDVKLSDRFTEFTIEEMGSEQAEKFLRQWCRAIEKAQQPDASEEQWERLGDTEAQEIIEAIKDNDGVKRLTANPLLLTILALIHRNGSRLPNRRVELYALAVKTLTEDWQLGKKLPNSLKVLLKENEVVELLAPLAYWMHEEKPSGLVTQKEVEEKLAAKLAELNDAEPESDLVQQAVEQFLRKVRETTGLFVERAPGVYGFMHLTFEEYFAARYIADNEVSDILEIIRSRLHEPRWNEPILLALGYYGIHSPKQVNKLVEQLFSNLEAYEPALQSGEIKIKNASSPDAILILPASHSESVTTCSQSEFKLKDLLFAGQVLAQVEVNSRIRSKLIQKLILTYVGLRFDTELDILRQILTLLRQLELFNQKGEVIEQLEQITNHLELSELMYLKAQLAILYVICCQPGLNLVSYTNKLFSNINPFLFGCIKFFLQQFSEHMTPALKTTLESQSVDTFSHKSLSIITALSYNNKDHNNEAITILEALNSKTNENLNPFVTWTLASCYVKGEGDKAISYYQQACEEMSKFIEPKFMLIFWLEMAGYYSSQKNYEQSIECYQKILIVAQELKLAECRTASPYNVESVSRCIALFCIAKSYQAWGKHKQAIEYYQKIRNLCQDLCWDETVTSGCWNQLADCYREWGKYEQALECQLKDLVIYQQLEEQPNIAVAYNQLGGIYQAWGKYEQAISHYQQSRDLYKQLDKQQNVANQWYGLAACYREWGKYQQALECQRQVLAIRQQLDDQPNIAVAYNQLGGIYQAWGKYEQAISHYQQSRDLYEQLGKQQNVANQWYNLAYCYRESGKYQQALECQLKVLAIRQQLDDQPNIAVAYNQQGSIYQAWGKYEQALADFQQSRDLYEQLGQQKNVASQWYNLAACYREWGKYQQALECQSQDLAIRQQLDDQPGIANAYNQQGWIYQAWGKYEQALAHHQQSRDLYAQLGKQQNVANQWYWLAACYREWGKYQQALDCQLQDLAIRQQLDDQPNIADAYCQQGSIYQAWGEYEQAIAHYQQSRDLYAQLDQQQNVANQWYWLADCYREWGKYGQALECQRQVLAICQQLDEQPGIASAYYQQGWIYQAWGQYEQAISHYQQSRDLYEQLGKQKNVANQWYWLAACYREWGKYQQALECELKDLAIRQQLDDQPNIADAYRQQGSIYQAWGKYEQALAHHQQSRDLYEQLGKQKNVANQWYWLADCYREWGKYQQALECQRQDLAIRQQLDDQPGIALAYFQQGCIYQAWGKYEQAISHHQQSRDLYEQLGQQKNVANLWYNLAACYREWGKYQQALDCELQDLAIRQQLDDQPNIADAYRQQGSIYQAWGKYEQAIAQYQQSRDLYAQLGKQQNVANLWYWLADCYREWGKYQQALDCELQDLAIRQQLDDQPRIALAYYQQGRIYQSWGKYEQALAHYQQSRDLYEQLGQHKDVADLWYRLAVCYREWGKYQQALDCELQDLAIRQQLDDQSNIADAYNQLGRIYRAWGEYEQALAHYQQSYDLYQQLGEDKSMAWLCRRIGDSLRLLSKNTTDKTEALSLLAQAEQSIRQAMQINHAGDYKGNLAYDYIALALLQSERLSLLPADDDPSLSAQITQFTEDYNTGLTYFTELGRTVDKAEKALDIARAYLEVSVLENLVQAEELAQESLQVFQEFKHRKLEAAAHKLLGEIYLKRAERNQPAAEVAAYQFFAESRQIYQELDLEEKAAEVTQLLLSQ